MDELSKLFAIMEAQETRLLGIAHCIVPKEEEIPIIEPVFVAPAATKDIEKSTPHSDKLPGSVLIDDTEKQDIDPLVDTEKRVLETPSDVPSIILSALSKSVVTEEPIKEIIATTTTTDIPIPNPNENDIDIVTYTDKLNISPAIPVAVAETSNVENDTVLNALNYINKLENVTVLETTPITTNHNSSTHSVTENFETTTPSSSSSSSSLLLSSTTSTLLSSLSPPLSSSTPSPSPSSTSLPLPLPLPNQSASTSPSIAEIVLGEMESVSKSPESDNYIYETFSPVSPVNISAISSFHRNDHLVLAEEPPEIPNDAVSVA